VDRSLELSLLDECLELAQANKPFMAESDVRVDVREYLDEARYGRELEHVFRELPNLVAVSSEVATPGAFITRTIAGVPILVVRGEDGVLRGFLNVCRHRGATVVLEAAGVKKRFSCPYHAWTYGTDGALVGVPHREGFPTLVEAESGLCPLPCFESGGFVWVVPNASEGYDFESFLPDTLRSELADLGGAGLEVFAADTRVYDASWKIILDGGLESYHFKVAHAKTIGDKFLGNAAVWRLLGDHVRSVLPRTSLRKLPDRPRREWDIRRCTNVLYSVLPNASILVQSDHLVLIRAQPLAIDRSEVVLSTLVPAGAAETEEAKGYFRANHELTARALDEDFRLAEQIQRGLATGANETFRFARYEAALVAVHEILARYTER